MYYMYIKIKAINDSRLHFRINFLARIRPLYIGILFGRVLVISVFSIAI